ncbi:unnamed protein product [Closterium sp. Naga37s-1]|nr:unnamed protein product [Closterium sp. Naga37s-1]
MSRLPLKSATAMKASKGPFQPDESEALTLSAKLAAIRIEEAANDSKKGKEEVIFKDAVSDAAPEGEDVSHDDDEDNVSRDNADDGSGPSGVTHLLNDEDDGLIAYDSDEEVEEASKGEIASRSCYPITLLIPEEFLLEVPRTQATIKGLVGIWKDELSDGAQAMALFFSAAGWFRQRLVGPRTAEAGVRGGSVSASAEACADRAARARRKMMGMRKLTRAEREATEAEERKQREEIAQMVEAQRKAREQAEGASNTNNWEVIGKKPANVGKAVEVPTITRRAVTNRDNCPYKGSRSHSVVSAKSLTGQTKSLGQPISSARKTDSSSARTADSNSARMTERAPVGSAQAGVLGKGQVRSGLPASFNNKGFEAPEKSAAALENKGGSSVWNKGSTSGSTTGGDSSSSVGGGGGGGARNKGTILCPAPPPRSSNEYTTSPIQASPPTRDNRTFSQVAKSSSRRSSGEQDKQGSVKTGGKEVGPSIVRLAVCATAVCATAVSEPSTGAGESEVTGTACLWSYPAIAPLLHPAPAAAAVAATAVSPAPSACDSLPFVSSSSFPSSSFTTPIKQQPQQQQQQQQQGRNEGVACGREWEMWGSTQRLTDAFGFTPPTFSASSSAALPSSPPLPASALSSTPVPASTIASLTTTTTTPNSYLTNPFALPFSSPFSLGFSPTLVPATPVDPAPLTNSPLSLSTPAAALPGTAVGSVERSSFTGSKNTFHADRHAFPGSWSAGGVASESSQQSPRFPGSWSAGGQDLTGFGDALKSNAFRAAIRGGGSGVGGGAGGGGMRAAWMTEMWDEDVPPAFVDCITQEIMRDPVITADGHSYEPGREEGGRGGQHAQQEIMRDPVITADGHSYERLCVLGGRAARIGRGEIMRDPVITADGHSYERAAIEKWIMRVFGGKTGEGG